MSKASKETPFTYGHIKRNGNYVRIISFVSVKLTAREET